MNDDPLWLLNLTEDAPVVEGTDGGWWLVSLLSFVICIGIGGVIALTRQSSDWFGVILVMSIGGGILLGAFFCLAFALVSLVKNEKKCIWAMLLAVPSLALLLSLLGLALESGIKELEFKMERSNHAKYLEQIRNDPEIALKERWHQSQDKARYGIFMNSFGDPKIHYTESMLQRIYDEAPVLRDYIFINSACSPEFLSAHFQEAFNRCQKKSYVMLANIVANPNTPIELVEEVAQAQQLPVGAVEPAKQALKKRSDNLSVHKSDKINP